MRIATVTVVTSVCIDAPVREVWAELARLDGIRLWSEAILDATCDGPITERVGAQRGRAIATVLLASGIDPAPGARSTRRGSRGRSAAAWPPTTSSPRMSRTRGSRFARSSARCDRNLEPAGDGTRVTSSLSCAAPVARLMAPMVAKTMRSEVAQLDRLREVLDG